LCIIALSLTLLFQTVKYIHTANMAFIELYSTLTLSLPCTPDISDGGNK